MEDGAFPTNQFQKLFIGSFLLVYLETVIFWIRRLIGRKEYVIHSALPITSDTQSYLIRMKTDVPEDLFRSTLL